MVTLRKDMDVRNASDRIPIVSKMGIAATSQNIASCKMIEFHVCKTLVYVEQCMRKLRLHISYQSNLAITISKTALTLQVLLHWSMFQQTNQHEKFHVIPLSSIFVYTFAVLHVRTF